MSLKVDDLQNVQDQYALRVLQAKAGLPSRIFGLGIVEAFRAEYPGLEESKVRAMVARRGCSVEYLLKFEAWTTQVKKQLNIKSRS